MPCGVVCRCEYACAIWDANQPQLKQATLTEAVERRGARKTQDGYQRFAIEQRSVSLHQMTKNIADFDIELVGLFACARLRCCSAHVAITAFIGKLRHKNRQPEGLAGSPVYPRTW